MPRTPPGWKQGSRSGPRPVTTDVAAKADEARGGVDSSHRELDANDAGPDARTHPAALSTTEPGNQRIRRIRNQVGTMDRRIPREGCKGTATCDCVRDATVIVTDNTRDDALWLRFQGDSEPWPLGWAAYFSGRFIQFDSADLEPAPWLG